MWILRFFIITVVSIKIYVVRDVIFCVILTYVMNYSVSHPRKRLLHVFYLYVMGPCEYRL
jgi:hypothetical protein